ncbi:hypothetical protein [Bradyrhizobium sp. RT5a]|uniref:hypothetical protein n=1 Tax=Bradyrhizobium sp. RT5a TaxID=3156380 RepID=UPI003390EE32
MAIPAGLIEMNHFKSLMARLGILLPLFLLEEFGECLTFRGQARGLIRPRLATLALTLFFEGTPSIFLAGHTYPYSTTGLPESIPQPCRADHQISAPSLLAIGSKTRTIPYQTNNGGFHG